MGAAGKESLTLSELVPLRPDGNDAAERLTKLVLNSVTSPHTRRSYETGLEQFLAICAHPPKR
jgi:hypothetical protein